jgi:hypothetical protein
VLSGRCGARAPQWGHDRHRDRPHRRGAPPVGLPGHGRVPPTLDPDDMVGVLGVLDAVFDPGTCELDVVDGPADCGIEYPEGAV